MKEATLRRVGALASAAWAGEMAAIGGLVAPVLFATLERADAGRAAARLFAADATFGIVAGALSLIVSLQLGRQRADEGTGRRFGVELGLALAALACIVVGHYALLPLFDAARQGAGAASFAVLHGTSTALFAVRFLLVAALAWRFSRLG